MRIISQDGTIDVPYEMSAIRNDDKLIILCMAGETGKGSVIATYSTSEKAQKAMEVLQEEYRFEKLFETLCSGMGDYPNKPFYYFQFPQDEDVEV